jgi:hypothetical protein
MPGPAEVVWRLVTDWEHQGDWMLEASDFSVLSEQREGVGVEAQATVRVAGLSTRDLVAVVAWAPHRHLGIAHRGWVSGRGDIHLTRIAPARTHVYWREELHPPLGLAGAVGLFALRPLIRRIFARDLRVLAALVRARSQALGRA